MDAFSESAAQLIFSAFPEWRRFAREERADDGSTFLVLEVPAPVEAMVEHGLVIDTANEEFTVGFDCYHAHFNEWIGDGDYFGTTAALEFVKQIVSERVGIVSWWLDDEWKGSAQIEAETSPDKSLVSNFNRLRVRSWRGSLNEDVNA